MGKPQRLANVVIFQLVLNPLIRSGVPLRLPTSDGAIAFNCGGGGNFVLLMTSHLH
jgi:hypothetical protein